MAVKQILPFGDPILRKKAKPAGDITPRIIRLLDDMKETLYDKEGRAGLAAPQVGILRRVVVMDCGDGYIELIDPEIVEKSGEQTGAEACLSYPGYYGFVQRAQRVTVRSRDREGGTFTVEAEDDLAVCMQHEIDHLDGILFIDRVQDDYLYNEETKRKIRLLDVIRLSNQGIGENGIL